MTEAKQIKPSDIILGALDILGDKKHWTQEAVARDSGGRIVGNFCPSATCFCIIGAIGRAETKLLAPEESSFLWTKAMEKIKEVVPHGYVAYFNDRSTHSAVIDMLTTAAFLQLAEEDETQPEGKANASH